jgi:hypothetical protein
MGAGRVRRSQVGAKHELSAGLLIGGKNLKDEAGRVNNMNILIATPGAGADGVESSG